ncbi:hypothetical protein [endosymbiont of Ridgeia piscesae]|jgi:hypothetical protein|uniref:Uncharacterized protein n=1 Tax=endosymbiont of Ridgeia piscesae TaxID=54398 RepID=A0A0T5Z7F6_9GAMM|nr:hypothetical protein [endosymbiont of Ridgeia piscesae]KRT55697.1 hypothetical protein Ga0074115_1233 [endosymbiont of Ridgeia piscesae]KRT58768.1 hypothetical protein Ga0076813_14195 [endosymbiont of Ridgeia piscesae]
MRLSFFLPEYVLKLYAQHGDEMSDLFGPCSELRVTLSANPNYYDYLHLIRLVEDGTVELIDGAGQSINTEVNGKYSIYEMDADTVSIKFYDLVEADSYRPDEKIRDIDPFVVKVVKEKGNFAFRQEVIWRIDSEDDWPCLLFDTRFVFEFDPLCFWQVNRKRNPYYLLENKEQDGPIRHYYLDEKKLTLKEMQDLGIPKESFW